MGGRMSAPMIGFLGAGALLLAAAWVFLRTRPDWLLIRSWCAFRMYCRACDQVESLFVNDRYNSRLFALKAM